MREGRLSIIIFFPELVDYSKSDFCLKVFYLIGRSSPSHLAEGGGFIVLVVFGLLLSVLISISLLLASPDHSPGYMMKA